MRLGHSLPPRPEAIDYPSSCGVVRCGGGFITVKLDYGEVHDAFLCSRRSTMSHVSTLCAYIRASFTAGVRYIEVR